MFVLFPSMSPKNLKPQSRTKDPISRNAFRHYRVRFCWTTFLETAVNYFEGKLAYRLSTYEIENGKKPFGPRDFLFSSQPGIVIFPSNISEGLLCRLLLLAFNFLIASSGTKTDHRVVSYYNNFLISPNHTFLEEGAARAVIT